MLLGIGTRVKFLTTTDAGVITQKLGDGMVMVMLDEVAMEIPAFEEDLVREEHFLGNLTVEKPKKTPQKDILPPKNHTISASNVPAAAHFFKFTLLKQGVSVALVPVKNRSGETTQFDIWLLNDTPQDVLFDLDFVLFDGVEWTREGKLSAAHAQKMGEMSFDVLNDAPDLDVFLTPIFTDGAGEKVEKTLKIRAKQLVKNASLNPHLQLEAHTFVVLPPEALQAKDVENIPVKKGKPAPPATNDLKKYTQEIVKKIEKKREDDRKNTLFDPIADVNEYAAFVPEIDLHIELLHENHTTLSNAEILSLQMRAFESYLARAIRLGAPRLYVIHGVGKGKLRDMIHARLRRHSDVGKFKNEYHERYGWGATEILLGKW